MRKLAVLLTLLILAPIVGGCAGYIRIDSDLPISGLPLNFPPHDPLKGRIIVESWEGKDVQVAIFLDGKQLVRVRPRYSLRVAVGDFGFHEVAARFLIWSSSQNSWMAWKEYRATFEVRPDRTCDDFGDCWKVSISRWGVSAY